MPVAGQWPLHLTGSERNDLLGIEPLFEQGILRNGRRCRLRWKPAAVTADKAYSAA
jgi:transposase